LVDDLTEWTKERGEVYVIQIANEHRGLDRTRIYGDLTINFISRPLLLKRPEFSESSIPALLEGCHELVSERL